MTEHPFDKSTFIGGWYMPESICDNLIDVYYSNQNLCREGTLGNDRRVEPESKISTELLIFNDQRYLIDGYLEQLSNILEKYKIKYPYSDSVNKYSILQNVKIQHYKPTEGYYVWHTENDGHGDNKLRHLVFMTYLNTVENAGTQFYHQKLTTPCRKGLTLIWPSAWTHTHRGVTNNEKDKFIITGWFSFE